MRRIEALGVALVATLAIGAVAASTASATKLILSKGGATLAPGEYVEFSGGYNNLEVTTSLGGLECEDFARTGFEASVATNSKGADVLETDRPFGASMACRSYTGNASVFLASIGGPLRLRANGKATAGQASMKIEFEYVEYKDGLYHLVECFYAHGALSGANTATSVREKLEVQLSGGLKLDSSRSSSKAKHLCPKAAGITLHLPFAFDEEGEAGFVEEQVQT